MDSRRSVIKSLVLAGAAACTYSASAHAAETDKAFDSKGFCDAVDKEKEYPDAWEAVAAVAKAHGIPDQISLPQWLELMSTAKEGRFRCRGAIQLHPAGHKEKWLKAMADLFGHDTDMFTRARTFALLAERLPGDIVTPRLGLHLLIDAWNAEWMDGLALHQTPSDAVKSVLATQWADFTSDSYTLEACTKLLSNQRHWQFGNVTKKWSLGEAAK